MRVIATVLAASAALAIAVPAEASVTVVDYTFTGLFSGTMALDFNSSQPFSSAYTLNSLNLVDGASHFTQANSNLGYDTGSLYLLSGTTGTLAFSMPFDPTLGSQNVGFATLTRTAGAVPEPATWAMMLLGFGAIGLAARRRKEVNAAAA